MRLLTLFIFLFFLPKFVQSQSETFIANNNIKVLTELNYCPVEGEEVITTHCGTVYETYYNKKGQKTKELNYELNENKSHFIATDSISYQYNSEGLLINEQSDFANTSASFTTTTKYNTNGLITSTITSHNNGDVERVEYFYDDNNHLMRDERLINNKIEKIHYYQTNSAGEVTHKVEFPVSGYYTYTYHDNGVKKTELQELIYDVNSENIFESKRSVLREEEFDEEGNTLRMFFSGNPNKEFIFTYNENGDVIKEEQRVGSSVETVRTYEYQYNSKGLWVYQLVFENEMFLHVNERRFQFYD